MRRPFGSDAAHHSPIGLLGPDSDDRLLLSAERHCVLHLTLDSIKRHAFTSRPEGNTLLIRKTGPTETKAIGGEVVADVVHWASTCIDGHVDLVAAGQSLELQHQATIDRLEPGHLDRGFDLVTSWCLAIVTETPTSTVALALAFSVECESVDLASFQPDRLTVSAKEPGKEVRTEVPHQRRGAVGFTHSRNLGRLEVAILDAASRSLGTETTEVPALSITGVEPVLLATLGPERELHALIIGWETNDLEFPIVLGTIAASTTALPPVTQAIGASTHLLDFARSDVVALAISPEPGELTAHIVGIDGEVRSSVAGEHQIAGELGCAAATETRLHPAAILADVAKAHELVARELAKAVDIAVWANPEVVVRWLVVTELVLVAEVCRPLRHRPFGKEEGVLLLCPVEELIDRDGRRARRCQGLLSGTAQERFALGSLGEVPLRSNYSLRGWK